ncbi:MAG TPA: hypothetical protein VH877_12705 [Polyangia bacterium]|jgi:CheY-like chemotaxis protein|nr:hypothetical protein [Polyangia bacterium]
MAKVAYLCTDLLFTSKIRETARALGHETEACRDARSLAATARDARLIIIDLRRPDALAALIQLRAEAATAEVPAIGFCDHERTDLMESAHQAGCSLVLAKGKFSSDLRRLLSDQALTAP